jgi:hypothetical protein
LRKTLVLVAALLSVVGAAVAATAAIPDANGVIHGCRNTKTGVLRVIDTDARQTCGKDEVELNWNQTGPQGPAGVSGIEYVQRDVTVPAYASQWQAAAPCPAGKQAIAGGYDNSDIAGSIVDASAQQINTNGFSEAWAVNLQNPSNSTGVLQVIATCVVAD